MNQDELNEIWEKIQNDSYKEKASEVAGQGYGRMISYPEKLDSNEVEDIMSIPNNDGTKRILYKKKKNEEKWYKLE